MLSSPVTRTGDITDVAQSKMKMQAPCSKVMKNLKMVTPGQERGALLSRAGARLSTHPRRGSFGPAGTAFTLLSHGPLFLPRVTAPLQQPSKTK